VRWYALVTTTAVVFALAVVQTWDLLTAGLGLLDLDTTAMTAYTLPRSGFTLNNLTADTDQFEWHRTNATAFVFRFEDLMVFFAQLLSTLAVVMALLVL